MSASVSPDDSFDLHAVRQRLGTRAIGLDLESALTRWRAAGGAGDEQAFVDWILAEQAGEAVMVTAVLPPRLQAALASPEAAATILMAPPDAEGLSERTIVGSVEADSADATVIGASTGAPAPGGGDVSATDRDAGASTPGGGRQSVAAGAGGSLPPNARYVILGEAGKGGMAVVHVARDLELMRRVALKRLAGSAAAHAGIQSRFLREVQISAQLDHPNIVPVYGLEVGPDGLPAYAMKLVEGKTLEAYLREAREFYERGSRPPDTHDLPARLEHFLKVCDAMAYAHRKGVVHRDLKPANVMIGRYHEIYVMDWGICRVLQLPDDDTVDGVEVPGADADADTRTRMGTVVGTARYMAPEQAMGKTEMVGPWSDQYSLGLILYEIATLQSPYAGKTMVDVLAQAAKAEIRPIEHAFGDRIPDELKAIIAKATSLERQARYADVGAFADDIRRFLRGDEVEARPDTLWQKTARRLARHRQAALLALVGLIALASLVTAGLLYRHERALEAAAVREREILEIVDYVATRGDVLQRRLMELQGELDALTSASALALQHTTPAPGARFYWVEDFSSASSRPPDLVQVDYLDEPVSLEFGAWSLAPGVPQSRIVPLIGRLVRTRHLRNELFARARVLFGAGDAGDDSAGDATLHLHDSGVQAFLIGLADGGALHLPGRSGLPPQFDPRNTPWYRLAAGRQGAHWGEPYIDAASRQLVVPVAQGIYAEDGRELGVVAVLLRLDAVIQNLLRDASDTKVRATLLLDAEGRVIASSGLLHPELAEDGSDVVTLQTFPEPALLEAIAARDTGYVESTVFGVPDVLVFDTIHPMDWVLVKVVEERLVEED